MSKKRRNKRSELNLLGLSETIGEVEKSEVAALTKKGIWTTLKNPSNWWMIAIIAFLSISALGAGLKYLDENAKTEMVKRSAKGFLDNNEEQSLLSKINPFLPAPLPNPTPQLSKEYIHAGDKLLAIQDAGANAAPPADLAVWRPSSGTWWVMGGTNSMQVSQAWGTSGDVPLPGDYDGDGKTDFCVFRSGTTWYIIYSSTSSTATISFGSAGDVGAPADYDGDGKTDIAVFRASTGYWYINQSSTTNTVWTQFGASGDKPIPADFDGDGKADIALWRNSNATFYSVNSTNAQTQTTSYGITNDKPACGDYDGDGKADISVWRSSNTTWYYKKSSDGNTTQYQFGIGTDKPVQNDYDADGKVDMALWRASESYPGAGDVGKWIIYQSSTGTTRQETWGITGDEPVPAYYRR